MTIDTPNGRGIGRLLPALVAGLVAALLVGGFLLSRPRTYTSTMDVVVVPQKVASANDSAALFDSLSRGQVIATAAEMYSQKRWLPDGSTVEVTAGNVAPSAVVTVRSAGSDAGQVTSALERVVSTATPEIGKVLTPYTVTPLSTEPSTPEAGGLSTPLKLVLALLAGLLTAILAAGAGSTLNRRRSR